MRRSLAVRIATLLLVVFTTVAPAYSAPRDDSEFGPGSRLLKRIVVQLKKAQKNVVRAFEQLAVAKP
jgi:hypothetical protein